MKFEEALIIAEERNVGDFLKFEVQLGEDEGKIYLIFIKIIGKI